MIREEHMDLFADEMLDLTGVTSVADGEGAVLDFMHDGAFTVPTYDILVKVTEKATSTGAPTLVLQLQTSKDKLVWKTLESGHTFTLAELTADTDILKATIPRTAYRYIRVVAKNAAAGTTFTAGKLFGTVVPRY